MVIPPMIKSYLVRTILFFQPLSDSVVAERLSFAIQRLI
jgi:hypothetical protein